MKHRTSFSGTASSDGTGIAPLVLSAPVKLDISDEGGHHPETELKRFEECQRLVKDEILAMKDAASGSHDEWTIQIFDSHLFLIRDPELQDNVIETIKGQGVSAESALLTVRDSIVELLESLGDDMMAERASDIRDLTDRMLAALTGQVLTNLSEIKEQHIIAAEDLSPLDTAGLNPALVQGIITGTGGYSCHTAIVARSLGIPAVTGIEGLMGAAEAGITAVVDGAEGRVILNPDEDDIKKARVDVEKQRKERQRLRQWSVGPTFTKDGTEIILGAHLGSLNELDAVAESGADGIGLFRTEFLFLGKGGFPNEQQQFEVYREVLERMAPKPVVIRTMDIGGDKLPATVAAGLKPEANPFLGLRGIRYSLKNRDIFRQQIRALLRASLFGKLKIMFPMAALSEELSEARGLVEEERRNLTADGILIAEDLEIGAMIEVPSAALSADEMARYSDFFSIGTNDLVQYTMAADRMNEDVSNLYQPMHPSVLKLIKMTADAAESRGVPLGVCGELAGDLKALPLLIGLGVRELSVAAPRVPVIRELISKLDVREMRSST